LDKNRDRYSNSICAHVCAKKNGRPIFARNFVNVLVIRGGLEPPTL